MCVFSSGSQCGGQKVCYIIIIIILLGAVTSHSAILHLQQKPDICSWTTEGWTQQWCHLARRQTETEDGLYVFLCYRFYKWDQTITVWGCGCFPLSDKKRSLGWRCTEFLQTESTRWDIQGQFRVWVICVFAVFHCTLVANKERFKNGSRAQKCILKIGINVDDDQMRNKIGKNPKTFLQLFCLAVSVFIICRFPIGCGRWVMSQPLWCLFNFELRHGGSDQLHELRDRDWAAADKNKQNNKNVQ